MRVFFVLPLILVCVGNLAAAPLSESVSVAAQTRGEALSVPSVVKGRPAVYSKESTEKLAVALRENYGVQEVERLLAGGADPNGRENANGFNMLTLAAHHSGDLTRKIALLLAYGANPNAIDGYGSTPACAVVEGLVESSLDTSAMQKDAAAALALLAAKGAEVGWFCDNYGNNPLHRAVHKGSGLVTATLLALDVDATQRNSYGNTPLMEAADQTKFRSEREVVDALLRACGEDIDWVNKHGESALYMAVDKESPEMPVVEALARISNPAPKTDKVPLIAAANRENAEVVKLLLAKGANPNAKGPYGTTALLEAVYAKHEPAAVDVTRLLLLAGADVNLSDMSGTTPLMEAVRGEHPQVEVVRLLLTAGADVTKKNATRETAADIARFYQHPELAELMKR